MQPAAPIADLYRSAPWPSRPAATDLAAERFVQPQRAETYASRSSSGSSASADLPSPPTVVRRSWIQHTRRFVETGSAVLRPSRVKLAVQPPLDDRPFPLHGGGRYLQRRRGFLIVRPPKNRSSTRLRPGRAFELLERAVESSVSTSLPAAGAGITFRRGQPASRCRLACCAAPAWRDRRGFCASIERRWQRNVRGSASRRRAGRRGGGRLRFTTAVVCRRPWRHSPASCRDASACSFAVDERHETVQRLAVAGFPLMEQTRNVGAAFESDIAQMTDVSQGTGFRAGKAPARCTY